MLDAERNRRANDRRIEAWLASGHLTEVELDALDRWLVRRREDALLSTPMAIASLATFIALASLAVSALGTSIFIFVLAGLMLAVLVMGGFGVYAAREGRLTGNLQSKVDMYRVSPPAPHHRVRDHADLRRKNSFTLGWSQRVTRR